MTGKKKITATYIFSGEWKKELYNQPITKKPEEIARSLGYPVRGEESKVKAVEIGEKEQIETVEKLLGVEKPDHKFDYQMLSRLKSDCDYYLGKGNRSVEHLYYKDEQEQINEMKKLYNKLPKEGKPEWLTYEELLDYEEKMVKAKSLDEKLEEKAEVKAEVKNIEEDTTNIIWSKQGNQFVSTNKIVGGKPIYTIERGDNKEWITSKLNTQTNNYERIFADKNFKTIISAKGAFNR